MKSGKAGAGATQAGAGEKGNHAGDSGTMGAPISWEDNWERGEYPFVRLENNRAACAICLMDFEEPKRTPGESNQLKDEMARVVQSAAASQVENTEKPIGEGSARPREEIEEVAASETDEERLQRLQLEDAGEGAQPLRLLSCGHVFHVSSISCFINPYHYQGDLLTQPCDLRKHAWIRG